MCWASSAFRSRSAARRARSSSGARRGIERGVLPVPDGSSGGAVQLIRDVGGRPGFLALVGPQPYEELPVGHLGLLAARLRAAERPPRRMPGRAVLDLAGLRSGSER